MAANPVHEKVQEPQQQQQYDPHGLGNNGYVGPYGEGGDVQEHYTLVEYATPYGGMISRRDRNGYEVPEEQVMYGAGGGEIDMGDTAYRGGHVADHDG
jgi:hypothetical protein